MTDFKEIEQQIADLRKNHFNWQTIPNCVKAAHTMTKLLAVVRAADECIDFWERGRFARYQPLKKALTELERSSHTKEGGE